MSILNKITLLLRYFIVFFVAPRPIRINEYFVVKITPVFSDNEAVLTVILSRMKNPRGSFSFFLL